MPATEPTPTTLPLDAAALDLLAEKIGQVVRHAVSQEFAKLRDPSRTGFALPADEPAKAVATKETIKAAALDRQGLIDMDRLAEMLSLNRRTLSRLLSCQAIPQPIRFGRCTRWREIEIIAWLEEGCPGGAKWEVIKKQAIRDCERSRRTR